MVGGTKRNNGVVAWKLLVNISGPLTVMLLIKLPKLFVCMDVCMSCCTRRDNMLVSHATFSPI